MAAMTKVLTVAPHRQESEGEGDRRAPDKCHHNVPAQVVGSRQPMHLPVDHQPRIEVGTLLKQ